MGDRGRLVVPAAIRERLQLEPGTKLIMLDTPTGVVLATRDQIGAMVRADYAGLDLVTELIADRHKEALAENAK